MNLPETWRAIVQAGPEIEPAKVGKIVPLTAKREHEFLKLLKRKSV